MRLWHYKLIPVLPKEMLVSQWCECIAIKRQWEKGTLKHRLVSYVKDYNKEYFMWYLARLDTILTMRKINHKNKYYDEILEFCEEDIDEETPYQEKPYPEHNDRYFKQCYYNLEEKYDRGIISDEEWQKIEDLFKEEI